MFAHFSLTFKGQQNACQDHDAADSMYFRAAANWCWGEMEYRACEAGEVAGLKLIDRFIYSAMRDVTSVRKIMANRFFKASLVVQHFLSFLRIS